TLSEPEPAEVPTARPAPRAVPRHREDEPETTWPRRQPSWRREPRRRDSAYCYNHDDTPTEQTCAACGMAFCKRCVVVLQGETLCGPCKNFRLRGLQRRPRATTQATLAFILALVALPVAYFAISFAVTVHLGAGVTILIAFLGLALPLAAVFLGVK